MLFSDKKGSLFDKISFGPKLVFIWNPNGKSRFHTALSGLRRLFSFKPELARRFIWGN
jgi:hypothetical protein